MGEGWGGVGRVEGVTVGLYPFPLTGAQVPITSYTCTPSNIAAFLTQQVILTTNSAQSVVDFGCVLSRKEPILLY